ncbi:hypothetical protein CRYUN_Cryun36dG0085500 [Craigia yunnanensis]
MGRNRSRSYSPRRRSRTPTRGRNDDDPRYRHRSHRDHRRSPLPSGLLIRNLPLDARTEDLRVPFERYGPVKDVYLPKNYYTGEPRGFGFVKFRYGEDAAEAKQRMDHQVIGGREIRIVFAEENRKTPQEMRLSSRTSGRDSGSRRTPPRSPRRRYRSYSRSLSPARHDSRFEFYLLEAFYALFLMRNQRPFSLSLINCIALLFYIYNVVKIINYGFHSSFLLIIEEHLEL